MITSPMTVCGRSSLKGSADLCFVPQRLQTPYLTIAIMGHAYYLPHLLDGFVRCGLSMICGVREVSFFTAGRPNS